MKKAILFVAFQNSEGKVHRRGSRWQDLVSLAARARAVLDDLLKHGLASKRFANPDKQAPCKPSKANRAAPKTTLKRLKKL
jgi:hypothetical protein